MLDLFPWGLGGVGVEMEEVTGKIWKLLVWIFKTGTHIVVLVKSKILPLRKHFKALTCCPLRKRSHFFPSYEKVNFSKTLSEIIKLLLVSDTDRDLSEMSFVHVVPKFRKSH